MAADEGHFRLWNPTWTNSTSDDCRRVNVHGLYRPTFEIAVTEASSAVAEIGTAADNVLNGTTTPVLLYALSSSDTDKDTSIGAVRAVHIIGITVASATEYKAGREKPVYSVEEIRILAAGGTTGVASVRYYLRVMHAYATEWGSGGGASHDAEGNITISNDGVGTTDYVTIDAGSNESNSSGLVYLVNGFWGRWTRCYVSLHDADINEA